ncbi:MAG: alpha/beta hydrolase fold domain-containing protein [Acidimicrobiales bacterium]
MTSVCTKRSRPSSTSCRSWDIGNAIERLTMAGHPNCERITPPGARSSARPRPARPRPARPRLFALDPHALDCSPSPGAPLRRCVGRKPVALDSTSIRIWSSDTPFDRPPSRASPTPSARTAVGGRTERLRRARRIDVESAPMGGGAPPPPDVTGTPHPAPGTRHPPPATRHPAPGTRHPDVIPHGMQPFEAERHPPPPSHPAPADPSPTDWRPCCHRSRPAWVPAPCPRGRGPPGCPAWATRRWSARRCTTTPPSPSGGPPSTPLGAKAPRVTSPRTGPCPGVRAARPRRRARRRAAHRAVPARRRLRAGQRRGGRPHHRPAGRRRPARRLPRLPPRPPHPFPAAVDDAAAAHTRAAGGCPHRPVALAGDSAGGARWPLRWRCGSGSEGTAPPAALALFCPHLAHDPDPDAQGRAEDGGGRALADAYRDGHDPADPLLSPLLAPADLLAGLPPTLVQTGTLDRLHPQAIRFARLARPPRAPVQLDV